MLLLALVLAAAQIQPGEGFHGGLSTGLGSAYDGAGVRGELGSNHFGIFVGVGLLSSALTDTKSVPGSNHSFSFGARWYHGVRSGWFVSLNLTDTVWSEFSSFDLNTGSSPTNPGRLFTVGAVGGYRFKLKAFFVELGVGPLWYRETNTFTCRGTAPPCATLLQRGPISHGWFPDAVVGTGFDL
jgi:hypothetical protein